MEKRTIVLLTFFFIIILITGLYLFTGWFSMVTGYFSGEDEKTKLAHCLKDQNAQFFGSQYCADCEKQLTMFGTSSKAIHYKDCGKEKELCPNIREIPAWYINKKFHYGLKTLTELQEISSCIDE